MKKKNILLLLIMLLAMMNSFSILAVSAQNSTDPLQHSDILSIKTDKFEMEYFYFGTGKRPYIILPGVSMKSIMPSADAITNSFAAFADKYTVYVFDRKKGIQSEYSVWDMADDTATAMMELGIQDADIFGASHGVF